MCYSASLQSLGLLFLPIGFLLYYGSILLGWINWVWMLEEWLGEERAKRGWKGLERAGILVGRELGLPVPTQQKRSYILNV